jgi:hypothetical protein
MIGGKIIDKMNIDSTNLFIFIIFYFLIKILIVQYAYNNIAPKLINNMTGNNNFNKLTFYEAFLFVIMANLLFSY